jgi:hypothetical protein
MHETGVIAPGAVAVRFLALRSTPRAVAAAPDAEGADRLPAHGGESGYRHPLGLTRALPKELAAVYDMPMDDMTCLCTPVNPMRGAV